MCAQAEVLAHRCRKEERSRRPLFNMQSLTSVQPDSFHVPRVTEDEPHVGLERAACYNGPMRDVYRKASCAVMM